MRHEEVGVPPWAVELLAPYAGTTDRVEVRRTRASATLFLLGDAVAKVHRSGTDPDALAVRLRVCADPRTPLLAPLDPRVLTSPDGRAVTLWPRVEVLAVDAEPPWSASGALLAALHGAPPPPDAPPHGWLERLRRAVDRAPRDLGALGRRLLAEAADRPEPRLLVHGDWHLGQLGRRPGHGWQLLDPDDVGVGHPAWDLARPAGFWAAGLLTDEEWDAVLDAYARACPPAVLAAWGDDPRGPWRALDLPARCAVFVAATSDLHSDDTAVALREACLRMAQ